LQATVVAILRHPPAGAGGPSGAFRRRSAQPGESIRVGALGLEDSADFNTSAKWASLGLDDSHRGERALCVQTSANVAEFVAADLRLKEELTEDDLKPGLFGENIFLDSELLSSGKTCIGDEFKVFRCGRPQRLRLQVSCPRLPCGKIDDRMGKTYTACGARAHCAVTGHAGLFFRVLEPGDLQIGDVLKLTARKYPMWDLARVSRLMYSHPTALMNHKVRGSKAWADRTTPAVLREEWMGNEEELVELASIPELAILEWREHLWRMLEWQRIGRYRPRPRPPFAALAVVGLIAAAALAVGVSRSRAQKSR